MQVNDLLFPILWIHKRGVYIALTPEAVTVKSTLYLSLLPGSLLIDRERRAVRVENYEIVRGHGPLRGLMIFLTSRIFDLRLILEGAPRLLSLDEVRNETIKGLRKRQGRGETIKDVLNAGSVEEIMVAIGDSGVAPKEDFWSFDKAEKLNKYLVLPVRRSNKVEE